MRSATLVCLLVVGLTLGVYAQTANHGFINFDDPRYVTENAQVKRGLTVDNVIWAFTAVEVSNWHPLTWLSHMADTELFGLRPGGHHLMSVLFHSVAVCLLFYVLARMTAAPWQSLFVAALFALHPLHVESVAWVSERKDILSCLFALLALLAYVRYVEKPDWRRYVAALLLFAAGLLAKPMVVSLPILLLLLDYWPLRRLEEVKGGVLLGVRGLVAEKVPFFLLSAGSSLITIFAQHTGGAMKSMETVPLAIRLQNAFVAYAQYLVKALFPRDMGLLYPFPQSIPLWQTAVSVLFLVLATAAVIRLRRCHSYLLVGWLWYLVTLLPVIGLVQVGGQSMADRYTYIPLIGIFVACAWGANDLSRGWPRREVALAGLAGAAILACATVTWSQLRYWRDEVDLYRHTLAITSGNYVILNNYGIALAKRGDLEGAVRNYREALQIWPRSTYAELNLGAALADQGRFMEAVSHYRRALELKPDYALAEMNLGKASMSLGRPEEAVQHYQRALSLDPRLGDAHFNLGFLLVNLGRLQEGWWHYRAALELDPGSPRVNNNMGVAFAQQGQFDEAAKYFGQALRIDPEFYEAHFNWGVALAKQQRTKEAEVHFWEVLKRRPDSEPARRWLSLLQGGAQ